MDHQQPAEPAPTALSGEDAELAERLVRASFSVMAVVGRVGATHDLSLTQVRLLGILRDRQPKMAELADRLGLDKSSITGLISRAEKRGLVERSPAADDRRSARVCLTAAGRALTGVAEEQIRLAVAELTGGLTSNERATLSDLLGAADGR